jgi:energy-coupling factor transporter ATP-binding protein EcfA2
VLESVSFGDSEDFPEKILLNQNLVAVIGPRSSGKSSLLAHIAHAVDPEGTERAQAEVEPHRSRELGPASGITWAKAADLEVEVNWVEPTTERGRVIYVPQNALYAISQRPGEITQRIEPAVRREDPELDVAMRQLGTALESAREQIGLGVTDWFRITDAISLARAELLDRGDRTAIEARLGGLGASIAAKREESALDAEESELYERIMAELGQIDARLAVIKSESHELRPHLQGDGESLRADPAPSAELRLSPNPSEVPEGLRRALLSITERVEREAAREVRKALVDYQRALDLERAELDERQGALRTDHGELIKKNEMNSEIEELARSKRRQEELLVEIQADEERIKGLAAERLGVAARLATAITDRESAIAALREAFDAKERRRDPMSFGLEVRFDPEEVAGLSELFARNRKGPLLEIGEELSLEACAADPVAVLEAVASGAQKLKGVNEPGAAATAVLVTHPRPLFLAEIEGDRIGGFETSSMSPGKQALFALSLILDDAEEPWPLLIDQPEDDLDSRSIATQLVAYLIDRKSERQIIMVSHDANLVVGADAEQVIVSNRHGANTKNNGERTFDYFSGSLEHSRTRRPDEIELECCGIREHSCDILDGGEEAFSKRRRKYKIS